MTRRGWVLCSLSRAAWGSFLTDQTWPIRFFENPRKPHFFHPVQKGVGSMLPLKGEFLVRNGDVPEERYLVAVDLEGEFAVWIGQRQQEERAFPRRAFHCWPF